MVSADDGGDVDGRVAAAGQLTPAPAASSPSLPAPSLDMAMVGGAARVGPRAPRRRQGGEADQESSSWAETPATPSNCRARRRHRFLSLPERNLDAAVVAFNNMNVPLSPVTEGALAFTPRARAGGGGEPPMAEAAAEAAAEEAAALERAR